MSDAPRPNENVRDWKARLKTQLAEQRRAKRDEAEQSLAGKHAMFEEVVPKASPTRLFSQDPAAELASGGGDTESVFRMHVASFAALREITTGNQETLEKMKLLIGNSTSSSSSSTEPTVAHRVRELNRLVSIAQTLGEVAVSGMWKVSLVGNENGNGSTDTVEPSP